MIFAAILEDNRDDACRLSRMLETYGEQHDCPIKVSSFSCSDDFFTSHFQSFDIIFLDIDLPDMSGMEVAQRIRQVDQQVVLIFTTNLAQFAIRGYEVGAMDYVLKPIYYDVLALKMDRAVQFCRQNDDTSIFIHRRGGFVRVSSAAVQYVEIAKHTITYHTEMGEYTSYGTMVQVMAQFPPQGFFRTTASYLVNLRHISRVDGLTLYIGANPVPISRLRRAEFMKTMNQYFNGFTALEHQHTKG